LKQIITITIRAHSRSSLTGTHDIIKDAIDEAKLHLNNGTRIQVLETRADDPSQVEALMGKLKWFSLDREAAPGQYQSPRKKGFWKKVAEEAKSIFNEDPDF
jgi:hypothetical protein